MTLKDYADFVTEFVMHHYLVTTGKYNLDAFMSETCFGKLQGLLGVEAWRTFVEIFLKRADCNDWFRFSYKVKEKGQLFLQVLAEFCEPLIERPAEKPEGGQNAAKA
jgi:broad specificity phosphatase PhoE